MAFSRAGSWMSCAKIVVSGAPSCGGCCAASHRQTLAGRSTLRRLKPTPTTLSRREKVEACPAAHFGTLDKVQGVRADARGWPRYSRSRGLTHVFMAPSALGSPVES